MGVALGDRQAVEVRPDPAHQHVVAVVQQVMRGNGCANVRRGFVDELHGITGGDVFEHHLEGREAFHDTTHVLIDEDFFAIEHVDIRSEEHTSELQSLMRISYAVFCLNKKKKKNSRNTK